MDVVMKSAAKSAAKCAVLALTVFTAAACARQGADMSLEARAVVDESSVTFQRLQNLEELKELPGFLPGARGVIIFPRIVKGGFLFGAEGGTGVLIPRDAAGVWGYPAFYSVGGASFGLQIGVQDAELIMIIRSEEGLNAVVDDQGKLGADAGASIGVVGVGYEAATTTNLDADIVAFANGKLGLFIGASVEGMVFVERGDLNEGYYGVETGARAVINGAHRNYHADGLRDIIAQAADEAARMAPPEPMEPMDEMEPSEMMDEMAPSEQMDETEGQ
ncbi:MAG: lipid-binding SYLF domain-containing protein [Rhodospirillales bacterium]